MASRRGSVATSLRRRRESNYDGGPSSVGTGSELNFAQRLLMANENAVTNIADLWVAAAINADNEDPLESSDDEYEDDLPYADIDEDAVDELDDIFAGPSTPRHNRFSRRPSPSASRVDVTLQQSTSSLRGSLFRDSSRRPSLGGRRFSNLHRNSTPGVPGEADELPTRRASASVPPIFAHVGVRTPPAVLEAQQLLTVPDAESAVEGGASVAQGADLLAPIAEVSRTPSPAPSEREPSLMSMLPVAIILQYGWLALHSTTHDQVFYLYLVS